MDQGATQKAWPTALELEKCLMNTSQEADAGAVFLRKLLQMDPSYGQYMTNDEDIAGMIQLFAKRFRTVIAAAEKPLQTSTLFMPLCEVTWRIIGYVLHAIIDVQDHDSLPVPKEAMGQVKCLLNTNQELSRKLNEMRRAYLRELSQHRDKQRRISQRAERALASLSEQPVMFYEPLAFVLDEQTKAFVREVVEERIKMEQTIPLELPPEEPSEEDLGCTREELEQQLKLLKEELKTARFTAHSEAQAAVKAKSEAAQWRKEVEKEQRLAQQHQEERDALQVQIPPLREEITALQRQLATEANNRPQTPEPVVLEDPRVAELQSQLEAAKRAYRDASAQTEALQGRLAELEDAKRQATEALEKAKKELMDLRATKPKQETVTVEVVKEDEELQRRLQEHMDIEKELRAANRALEKALEEERARNNKPQPKPKKNDEKQITEAVAAITAQFEKQLEEKDRELERLRRELEAALDARARAEAQARAAEEAAKAAAEAAGRHQTPPPPPVDDSSEKDALRQRAAELQEKLEMTESENISLREQVEMLLAKLEEVGGKELVEEMKAQLPQVRPMDLKKRRRKKAYERLYDDAQRRILDLRFRELKIRQIEQRELLNAVATVKDKRSLLQVEMLGHLRSAAEAGRNRFHDALANYHDRNSKTFQPSDPERDPEDGADWYGAERNDMRYGFPYRAGRRDTRSVADEVLAVDEVEVVTPSHHGRQGSPQMLFGGSSSASSPYGGGATRDLLQQQLQQQAESLQQQLPQMSSQPIFGMRTRRSAHTSAGAAPAIRADLGLQPATRRTSSGGMLRPPTGPARSRDRSESPGRHLGGSLPAPLGSIYTEFDSPLMAFAPAATAHAPGRHNEASTGSPSPPPGYPAMPGQALLGSSVLFEQPSVLGRVPSSAALEPLILGTQTLRSPPEGEEVQPFLAQSLSCPTLYSSLEGSPQASGAARGQMSQPAHQRGLTRLGGNRLRRSKELGDEGKQFCVLPLRSQGSMAAMHPS